MAVLPIPQTPGGTNVYVGVVVTQTPGNVGGDTLLMGGDSILILAWGGAAGGTVTITSQADPFGRTKDITTESIGTDELKMYGPFSRTGWADGSGDLNVDVSVATILWSAIRA